MEAKKITVFGKNYVAVSKENGCFGCVFNHLEGACDLASHQFSCELNRVIFKEEIQEATTTASEQTFTATEVLEIMEYLGYGIINRDEVKSEMEKRSNPDYAKYIELKKKFG